MNTVHRVVSEYVKLMSVLSWRDRLQFAAKSLACAPECLRQRKLAPIDAAMRGDAVIVYRGQRLIIPVPEIDTILQNSGGDSATFGAIREMFANDVYLRAFKVCAARTVIDLGANRGLFMLIAYRVMGASNVIGVDPLRKYKRCFDVICARNNIEKRDSCRAWAMIDSADGPDSISMKTLLGSNRIDSITFLKCDIEGGEFPLFLQNNDWISRTENVAMELHNWAGNSADIVEVLAAYGFKVLLTDQFFAKADHRAAAYLYASRVGNLISVS